MRPLLATVLLMLMSHSAAAMSVPGAGMPVLVFPETATPPVTQACTPLLSPAQCE